MLVVFALQGEERFATLPAPFVPCVHRAESLGFGHHRSRDKILLPSAVSVGPQAVQTLLLELRHRAAVLSSHLDLLLHLTADLSGVTLGAESEIEEALP